MYPAEVKRKLKPGPWTDIHMLFASLRAVGVMPPSRFAGVFSWCLAASPAARPQNAWELQDRWRDIAAEEYGPPKFLELVLPGK